MAVVVQGAPFIAHPAATPQGIPMQGYHISHSTPPMQMQMQMQTAPYYMNPHAQFAQAAAAPYRVGSTQPQQPPHPHHAQHPHYAANPSYGSTPQLPQPLPPLAPHNEVPLNRDQLITILEYFSQLVTSRFENRGLRLIVHGGACMLLHPGLYALATEHASIASHLSPSNPLYPLPRRQTTRDVDYLHRAFVKDWEGMGRSEAEGRLKDCISTTARAFGLGADWMNCDADISLPMANDGTGKIYDPIHQAAITANNVDLHTVFLSKNKKLTLVSVAPVWSVALKLRRYTNFDPGDICLILRNGTKLNKVRWSESTLEGWLRKEAWPMGYHNQGEDEIGPWRQRLKHAIALVLAWPSVLTGTAIPAAALANGSPPGAAAASGATGGNNHSPPQAGGRSAAAPAMQQQQQQQHPMFVTGAGPQAPTPIPRPHTSSHHHHSQSVQLPVASGTGLGSRSHTPRVPEHQRTQMQQMQEQQNQGQQQQKMPLQNYDMNISREFDDMRIDTLGSRYRDRERERNRRGERERDGERDGGREREKDRKGHQRAQSSMGMVSAANGAGTWWQQQQGQAGQPPQETNQMQQQPTNGPLYGLPQPHAQFEVEPSGPSTSRVRSRSRLTPNPNLDEEIGFMVSPPTPTPSGGDKEKKRREERGRDKDRSKNRRGERLNKILGRGSGDERERSRSREPSREPQPQRERDRERDRSRGRGQERGQEGDGGRRSRSRASAENMAPFIPPTPEGWVDPSTMMGVPPGTVVSGYGAAPAPNTQPVMWHSHPNPRPASTQPLRAGSTLGGGDPAAMAGAGATTWHSQGLQAHHAYGQVHAPHVAQMQQMQQHQQQQQQGHSSSLAVPTLMPYGSVAGGPGPGEEERGRTRSGPSGYGMESTSRSRSRSVKRRPPPLLLSPAMDNLNLRGFD